MYTDLDVKPARQDTAFTAVEPADRTTTRKPVLANLRTRKTNTMNLLNEALARARMRELWRDETRGYVGRHRGARDTAVRAARRREGR